MCAERSVSAPHSRPRSTSLSRKDSRQLQARVFLLDDSVHTFSINSCALGSELFTAIIEKQTILESDYFDLEYVNCQGVRCWIDHTKSIVKQVGTGKDLVFIFAVKFYTPHPNLLEEEYTRYLFALQIKRDIVSGQLICSTNTSALLASYIAQAEIGDFLDDDYIDNNYLRQLKLVNQPNDEILNKIMEFHKTHIGMSPSEADFHLLDTARKIEYYGVKMHLAKDHENLPLNLSVTHMGVVVFQNLTKINTFSWAKIRKLSFKRKKFLIKLHPEGYGYYKGMVEFYFETRDDCKRFWKKCIEHHSFFRCPASDKSQRKKPRVVTKGSSFRYCGRTQKELIEYVRENYTSKRDHFERPTKAKIAKSPHNAKNGRLGKSYHPFAIKSSYSAPSRAVSDSSELNRTGMPGGTVSTTTTHTPRQQRSVGGVTKPRWSHSAGQSPHEDSREVGKEVVNENNKVAVRDSRENKITANNSTVNKIPSQKRSRKGRKFIQVSRTGSSADDDDDKRVTASEMSLTSSGRWEPTNDSGPMAAEEDPLPAREAFRGTDRLCRQRASIGGLGDVSDSDQGKIGGASVVAKENDRTKAKPIRQASEPVSRESDSPSNEKELQDPPQRIVCIDQYRSRRPRHPDSLVRPGQPLVTAKKRYKSTPNDVAGNCRLQTVDQVDNKELLSDIPYVLLRRHKSPEQSGVPGSSKSASHSRRSLVTKSLKSVKDTVEIEQGKEPPFGQMRHSKSLDRRLVAIDSSSRHIIAPKSPKLLREEYMQSQRRHVSDRDTIEALKNQLRASSSVRNMGRISTVESSLRGQSNGPMFVSAYRLPPVNNFSAKDDTMSPQTRDLDRIYGRMAAHRERLSNSNNNNDLHENDGDDEVDHEVGKKRIRGYRNQLKSGIKNATAFSDSDDDSQMRETTDLESLLGILPGNPIYLDSSSSSDDGEFDISPDRCSRPRSVSENEFKLRTPRSSRRSSVCRGHNSSLSLTDSSFNSDASFQSEDGCDMSGSPYSFLADCSQNQESSMAKNLKGSSGESSHLPDDNVPTSQMKSDEVNLQVLEVPLLPEDSPDEEEMVERNPSSDPCISAQDSMSVDRDESPSFTNEERKVHSQSSSNVSSSDHVVIVNTVSDPDTTIVDQPDFSNDISGVVVISSPEKKEKETAFSDLLESMLKKRLTGSPFLRTSTPTKEYTAEDCYHIGSTSQLNQKSSIPSLYSLKSAISVPGLSRNRVSPFNPLPAHIRRPFTSSSSSNSSSTSSLSPPHTNQFMNVSDLPNPSCVESSPEVIHQPDIVTANNIPSVDNQYEKMFEQSMSQEPSRPTGTSNLFSLNKKQELDRALVFLNEGALASISVGKSPTESGNADKFQETVEGNLMSYESSEYTSRAHSTHDEEEPDEYVLPSDHRSFSPTYTSSSSSDPTSESGEYPATKEEVVVAEAPIEEQSETSSSTSEGSEEIEPFPPPPPQSDLLIFDERDEDIFQQMQQRDKDVTITQVNEPLPHLDVTSPSSEFPQPPPSLTNTYLISKDEPSSSDILSLFTDESVEASVIHIDEDSSTVNKDTEIEVEEEVIPRFCSLLYDDDLNESNVFNIAGKDSKITEDSKENDVKIEDDIFCLFHDKERQEIKEEIIPRYCSLLDDNTDNDREKDVKTEEDIFGLFCDEEHQEVKLNEVQIKAENFRKHCSLLFDSISDSKEKEFVESQEENKIKDNEVEVEVEEEIIPRHCSLLIDGISDSKEKEINELYQENKINDNEVEIEEEIIPRHCSLLDEDNNKNEDDEVEVEEEIIPRYCPLLYDLKSEQLRKDEKEEEEEDVKISPGNDNEDCTIPRYYSLPYDDNIEEEDNFNDYDGVRNKCDEEHLDNDDDDEVGMRKGRHCTLLIGEWDISRVSYEDIFPTHNDPLPCSFDLSQLNCQSPEETMDDGEC